MNIAPWASRNITSLLFLTMLLLALLTGCATRNFYAATPVADPAVYEQLQQQPGNIDSVTVQAGVHYQRGSLYNFFWGGRHRSSWAAPVTVPVLDLDTVHGGLRVEKIGGGMQTINATMIGGDGMTYALRSIDKRPVNKLPWLLQKTFISNFALDMTSSHSPYGALVVAPLANATAILHYNPQLFYVRPNEKRMGEHQELLSDRVYLLEEKFNDKRALTGHLAEASDIVGTNKMLSRRYDSQQHTIDKIAFARARLLDLLIGDRDRHEGQWEWAVYEQDGHYTYFPIPKDRDNAFFRFEDGVFSWLMSRKVTMRKFETFSRNYKDVKALMLKSEFIDAHVLAGVTQQQFDSLAHAMKQTLTDSLIDKAVLQLPEAVYQLEGPELALKLKSRRDGLDKAALKFYSILAKKVTVAGTDEADLFEVERLNDEETLVRVREQKNGTVTYQRRFLRSETEEIILQGLDGPDRFELKGQAGKGIKITILGGAGKDTIHDTSLGKGNKTLVYDADEDTVVQLAKNGKYKKAKTPKAYKFQRKGTK